MRKYRLDDKACKILCLAGKGYTQVQISKELGMTESAVSQRTDSLQKYKYLRKQKSGFIITFALEPLGVKIVSEIARRGINSLIDESNSETYSKLERIHNIEFKWSILKRKSTKDYLMILKREKIDYMESGLNNHHDPIFRYKTYTAIISGISLILRCQERIGSCLETPKLICDIFDEANAIALEIEDMFGIKLLRKDKDTIYADCIKLEIALLDNPLAKAINNR